MRWVRGWSTTAVAAVLATGAVIGNPNVPTALASCIPGRPNEDYGGFSGTQATPATAPDGVKADIEEYQPYVTNGSEVSGWVMLNRGGTRWAQVGWWRAKDGGSYSRHVFVQYTTDAGDWPTHFWAAETGSTNYRVDWNPATDTYSFKKDGAEIWSANLAWNATTYEIYGETHRKSDQMPGGTSAHMSFVNTYMNYSGSSGWWSLTSPAGANNPDWYGAKRVSSVEYEVWDKACTS